MPILSFSMSGPLTGTENGRASSARGPGEYVELGLRASGNHIPKKGRDMLIETEEQATLWDQRSAHTDVDGDPLGDNKIEYRDESGKSIVLKLKTASSVAGGILDQYDLGRV